MPLPITVYLDRAQPWRASSPGTTTRPPAPERGRRGSWRWPSSEALFLVRRRCAEQGAHLPLDLALVAYEDVAASLHDDRQVLHRIAFSVVSKWHLGLGSSSVGSWWIGHRCRLSRDQQT